MHPLRARDRIEQGRSNRKGDIACIAENRAHACGFVIADGMVRERDFFGVGEQRPHSLGVVARGGKRVSVTMGRRNLAMKPIVKRRFQQALVAQRANELRKTYEQLGTLGKHGF